jgi:uridine kinase
VSHKNLLAEIANRLQSKPNLVITIDGPAGAGKTTLASAIAKSFDGVEVVHMDDLYRGWLLTLGPTLTRELQSIFLQLEEDGVVEYQKYDWVEQKLGELISFEIPRVLVLEGVGAGQPSIAESVDIRVWVEVPIELGLERVLARDGTHIADEMEQFLEDQEAYFTTDRPKESADFLIPGN